MTLPAGIVKISHPDRDDYYLGSCLDGVPSFHVGAYSDGAFSVPAHWWNAVARNRKVPITIKRTPAQIVAANRMFPFGDTGCKVGAVADYKFQGPMDSAGITIYMPSTGERPDIGLITDAAASYMLGGKPGPMLAWAQAGSSCPMHFLDENTGKPISLLKYPKANSYSQNNQGAPWLDVGPPTPTSNGYRQFGGGWTPQQGHYCEMSYLAHVATLDMGFLEDLQYSTNFTTGICDASKSTPTKTITNGELRGLSWAFRNLFMCHAATLDAEIAGTLPATCLPSSYWKTLLDNQLAYYTATFMNDPTNQYFRLVSGGNRFGPWQCDYMLEALAFGVLTGHSDWVPLYIWALKNVIDRTSGKSGYPVGWGGAYYLNTCEWGKNIDGTYNQNYFHDCTIQDGNLYPPKPLDWYGTFLFQVNDPNGAQPTPAQIASLQADQFNGGKAMVGVEYLMTTRAVLVMASIVDKKGLANVRLAYPDLDTCIANVQRMHVAGGSVNPRASVIDILPPVIQLPTGEIIMSEIAFNAPFTADVSFKDNKGSPMVPDTVTWDAPASFKITPDQTDKLKAHGVYGAEGTASIKATGIKDGISVPVTKEVTVPAAPPFLASGEITLS